MLNTYDKYREPVPSALSAVPHEPRHLIYFLSVFVKLGIKHLQWLTVKIKFSRSLICKACRNATNESTCISSNLYVGFAEDCSAIVYKNQVIGK